MNSVCQKSENSHFLKQAVELLSEDDCIILRKSRKGIWYKPYCVQLNSKIKSQSKSNPDESLLVDNGRRSRERIPAKSHSFNSGSFTKSLKIDKNRMGALFQSSGIKHSLSTEYKDSKISISCEGMAEMLHLSIRDKNKALLDNICRHLKYINEKAKKSIFNKLSFNERLIVVKAMYSRNNNKVKSGTTHKRDSSHSNYRLSSSLSRIDEKLRSHENPIRKSFSFLRKDSPSLSKIELLDTSKRQISIKEDPQLTKILIKQMEELQNQNSELFKTVKNLTLKNFKLEQDLEGLGNCDIRIKELKSKMENLTKYHDEIMDQVYNNYYKLTKNLKKFKFNSTRSLSVVDISENDHCTKKGYKKIRSHSLYNYQNSEMPMSKSYQPVYSTKELKKINFNGSIRNFLSNRKLALEKELIIATENIQKIDKIINSEPINSSIYKRHILEKEMMALHQSTLESLLKSME